MSYRQLKIQKRVKGKIKRSGNRPAPSLDGAKRRRRR